MDEIQKLRQEREKELATAQELNATAEAETRDLTDDELTQVEAHTQKASEMRGQIEAAEQARQRRQVARDKLKDEDDYSQETQAQITRVDPAAGTKLKVIAGEDSDKWRCFGEYLDKVRAYAVSGLADRRLYATHPMGLNTVLDSEGHFLIPDQYGSQLLKRVYEMGQIIQRCRKISLAGDTYKIPYINETHRTAGKRMGGVRHYWIEQGSAPTATMPDFGQVELNLKKVACLGYVTEEMVKDYAATGGLLFDMFAQEITFGVEDAIFRGTGAGQPLGVLSANCVVQVTKETNQTAATLWGPNIVKMWARMWSPCRRNSVWLVNQDVEPQLWGLALEGRYGSASGSADAIPIYYPAGSILNQGEYGILMGRPVLPVEYCSTLGTVGDIMLCDFSQYLLADKASGIRSDSSIHVRFTTDERTFRVIYRVDGQPWWSTALTPYQGSNTLTPFVKLEGRS